MSKNTTIEWTERTWNPFSGCVKVSPGCDNCYAETLAERYRGTSGFPNGFDLTLRPHVLGDLKKWKKPARIFVESMSDLFLGSVPVDYFLKIWETMLEVDWHQYQILTKRPIPAARLIKDHGLDLPPNFWLGVSVESQEWADQRIPALLDIPSKVRWLSCEPLLGPVDITSYIDGLDWVVDGGESGANRRPASYDWFRSIRDQCQTHGIAYFHKQGNAHWSGKDRFLDGRTWDEYPALCVCSPEMVIEPVGSTVES